MLLLNWDTRRESIQQRRRYAGTFAFGPFRYRPLRLQKLREKAEQSSLKLVTAWNALLKAEQSEWVKMLELIQLQLRLSDALNDLEKALTRRFREKISPVFARSLQMTVELRDRLNSEIPDTGRWKKHRRLLLDTLRRRELPKIMDSLLQESMENELNDFRKRCESAYEAVSATHPVVRSQPLHLPLPLLRVDSVQISELISDELRTHFSELLSNMNRHREEIQEKVLRDINEIDQVIEYNFNSGMSLLESGKDAEAKENILEGLARAKRQIDDIPASILKGRRDILDSIQDGFVNQLQTIRYYGDTEKILQIRLRWGRARTQRKMLAYLNRGLTFLRSFGPHLLSLLRLTRIRVSSLIGKFRKVTGLDTLGNSSRDNYIRSANSFDRSYGELPYIYRQLFRSEPLDDDRFLLGRDTEMAALHTAFNDFRLGIRSRTALVGEKGSGRSTLLNMFMRDTAAGTRLYRIDFPDCISDEKELASLIHSSLNLQDSVEKDLKALSASLNSLPDKAVLLFDNIHFLMTRSRKGYHLISRFSDFLAGLNGHYVMVTSSVYAWEHLSKTHHFTAPFKVIQLGSMKAGDVENVILKRHRISGYRLEYLLPDERRIRRMSDPEKQQDMVRSRFFQTLDDICQGNIMIAMHYWLNAIHEIKDDLIIINPELNSDTAWLHRLPDAYLFVLHAVLLHQRITADRLNSVLPYGNARLQSILSHLNDLRCLHFENSSYFIHPGVYRQVVQVLKVKNILH